LLRVECVYAIERIIFAVALATFPLASYVFALMSLIADLFCQFALVLSGRGKILAK
jgi:hypothetical protein